MLLQDFLPSPPLREYVRIIQVIHFVFEAGVPLPFKAYPPRPEQCLSFYPRDAEAVAYPTGPAKAVRPRAALIGQHAVVSNRYVGREFLALQVVLQPGALYRLTSIPQPELTNTYIDAEAVWPAELRQLNERLSSAAAWPEMLPMVEEFLLGRIRRVRTAPHPADAVGRLLLHPSPHLTLDALAGHACLSPRQLDRQFAQRLGVGPALYARIVRFDRAFRLKNSQPGLDWLSIALACGYYDHQHLAKDYRAFTGSSPSAFFEQDNRAPERAFGLVEA
ncbi:AraC family transcriptional regulator [Hymenobacter sp. 5317J-9]|uniref:helix-turn-helix domain-containing protein n=1 Tax=Hymenobacter sp. 5317J-9 TaxID=2932250 RepID=UPI001FD70719|nr:helix-turn-helix domain-containing protein [Hymenobacter sp. 5317J-9]UOQ98451.1 AraC family transcriptional regulator [Hymenobacter sp. 5317J-9]